MPKPTTPPKKRRLSTPADVLSRQAKKLTGQEPVFSEASRKVLEAGAKKRKANVRDLPPPPKPVVVIPPKKFRGWDNVVVSITLCDGNYNDIGRSKTIGIGVKGHTTDVDQLVKRIAEAAREQVRDMLTAKKAHTAKIRVRDDH